MIPAPGKKTPGTLRAPSGDGQAASALLPANARLSGSDPAPLEHLPGHLAGALKKRWKCYRKELKRCQKKFSQKAVHQFRVESRRLISLIELATAFLPQACVEAITRCLKRNLDTFDDLRDTHVQLQLTKKLRKLHPEAREFECYLRKREKRVDRRTRKEVRRVKTKPLVKLIAASRNELEASDELRVPAGASARRRRSCSPVLPHHGRVLLDSVEQAFQRTLELKNRIDPERTETIHCTRVAFKKFRYMVETLSDFLPLARSGQLAAMHRYQTLMGDVQDLVVLIQAFDKFCGKKRMKSKSRPVKSFREALLRRRRELITRYLSRSDQLLTFWPSPKARPS